MNTNTIFIFLVVGLLISAGAFVFFKQREEEGYNELFQQNLKERFPNLGDYTNEPKTSWGDFAHHIKNSIVDPTGETDKQKIYDNNVDAVRGFLKLNNIEMSGWAVKVLASEINDYLKNDGRTYTEI